MVYDDFIEPGSTDDQENTQATTGAHPGAVTMTHTLEDSIELDAEALRVFELQLEAVQVRRALWRVTAAQPVARALDLMTGRRFGPWWELLGVPGVEIDGVFYETEPPAFARQIQQALRTHHLKLMGLLA
jgi:hypothetical protein